MTYSLVARSTDGTSWGVAVASRFLAAGAVVPAARPGLGAMATQSSVDLRYVPDGFALLAEGRTAPEVLDRPVTGDEQREARQVGLVGATGPGAALTGSACIPWAGSARGADHGAQGDQHDLFSGGPDLATLLPLTGAPADEVRGLLGRLGYRGDALDSVLFDWMGRESYEERHVPGSLDPVVLRALREAATTVAAR